MDCESSGAFSIVETVWAADIDDAAARLEIEPADVTCAEACAVMRSNSGEITVDRVTSCTWDVDPASPDTGELGQISCSGEETEQTCLG